MTRVNGVYEREVAVHMNLVAGNDGLIHLDGTSDPYDNGNGGAMLGQNISTCNRLLAQLTTILVTCILPAAVELLTWIRHVAQIRLVV